MREKSSSRRHLEFQVRRQIVTQFQHRIGVATGTSRPYGTRCCQQAHVQPANRPRGPLARSSIPDHSQSEVRRSVPDAPHRWVDPRVAVQRSARVPFSQTVPAKGLLVIMRPGPFRHNAKCARRADLNRRSSSSSNVGRLQAATVARGLRPEAVTVEQHPLRRCPPMTGSCRRFATRFHASRT